MALTARAIRVQKRVCHDTGDSEAGVSFDSLVLGPDWGCHVCLLEMSVELFIVCSIVDVELNASKEEERGEKAVRWGYAWGFFGRLWIRLSCCGCAEHAIEKLPII
jgi:hypothetical protein